MTSTEGWIHDWRSALEAQSLRGRPFVTVAFAVSCDGFLSAARGTRTRVSSPASLAITHGLRGQHDAILVGSGTVLADDPLLTTRDGGPTRHRVVLDSMLSTPASARLLSADPSPALIMARDDAPVARLDVLYRAGAQVERVAGSADGVDLKAVLARLRDLGVRSVMVEGGARVLESFFTADLVDYVCQTVSPQTLAGPTAVGLGVRTRAALARWRHTFSLRADVDQCTFGRFTDGTAP